MTSYYLAGANHDGEDKTHHFLKHNYLQVYYDGVIDQRLHDVQEGDRIAIKSRNGQGSSNITIKAVGVVEGITETADCVIFFMTWTEINSREVESRGCFRRFHGPYEKNRSTRKWLRDIFAI